MFSLTNTIVLFIFFSWINTAYSEENGDECQKEMQLIHSGDNFKLTLINGAICSMPNEDKAIYYLDRAITNGFHNIELLETNQYLKSLRKHHAWSTIIKKVRIEHKRFIQKNDSELYSLFLEDQSDRTGEVWMVNMGERDKLRVEKVNEKLKNKEVKTAADYFHAAIIMQHGTELEHYRLAISLSQNSLNLEPNNKTVRWLNCAAKNRFHLVAGNRKKLTNCKTK